MSLKDFTKNFFKLKIIDISPKIGTQSAVFPGDQKFEQNFCMETKNDDHLTLSSILTTLHIGAHTDAPIHYGKNELDISNVELDSYIGECQIIEVNSQNLKNNQITLSNLNTSSSFSKIVIFKTSSFLNPNLWTDHFTSINEEVINFLAKQKVKLIGIDTPSIDPSTSKELYAHKSILKNNLRILEGLDLNKVNSGIYFLIALPLNIENGDASPVRAILLSE